MTHSLNTLFATLSSPTLNRALPALLSSLCPPDFPASLRIAPRRNFSDGQPRRNFPDGRRRLFYRWCRSFYLRIYNPPQSRQQIHCN